MHSKRAVYKRKGAFYDGFANNWGRIFNKLFYQYRRFYDPQHQFLCQNQMNHSHYIHQTLLTDDLFFRKGISGSMHPRL